MGRIECSVGTHQQSAPARADLQAKRGRFFNHTSTSWTSLAFGLLRAPLAARIPERLKLHGTTTKYVLKKAMERYLPSSVLYRSKTGFGAPLRQWIDEDLQQPIEVLLGRKQLGERGLFEADVVARVLDENKCDIADHAYLIYALLSLELWQQTYLDRPGEEVTL